MSVHPSLSMSGAHLATFAIIVAIIFATFCPKIWALDQGLEISPNFYDLAPTATF
jgi:hypothetical protein